MEEADVIKDAIFITITGSKSYGTNMEGSDTDKRGICIPSRKNLYFGLGRHHFAQKEKWASGEDMVIFDMRKAIELMLDATPNMLELLYTPERFWLRSSKAWEQICACRDDMMSKKIRQTLGGYAFSQLKRIRSHRSFLLNPPNRKPCRSDFGLPERRVVSKDELNAFTWLVSDLLKGSVEMTKLSESTKLDLAGINFIGVVQAKNISREHAQVLHDLTGAPDGFIESCMREKKYLGACRDFEAYHRWAKCRNPDRQKLERDSGYDTKHASHLVRLMRMAEECLEDGQLHVFREDREELLAIRKGAWTFEEVEEFAHDADAKLDKAYKTTSLPDKPNVVKMETLCIDLIEDRLHGRI